MLTTELRSNCEMLPNECIELWDDATCKKTGVIQTNDHVVSLAFSPANSKLLAACCSEGTIHLWDAGTGKEIVTWKAHDKRVTCVSFPPDGKSLVTCCYEEGMVTK